MAEYADLGNYGVDPWASIDQNERTYFDPYLRDRYLRQSVYSRFATYKVDMDGPAARQIFFNDIMPPRPYIAPIGHRQNNATRLHSNSWQRDVVTDRYGNGMSFHKESDLFNYWKKNGEKATIRSLIQGSLGQVLVDHIDLLARQ
jgi:hypothetical protein